MENLPTLYYEVQLARIQVEHLLETARTLLRPWPDRDPRGRVKTKQVPLEPPQEAIQDVVSHELEDLKVLDEVLAKARHVKVQHKASLAPYKASTKSDKTRAKRAGSKSTGDKASRAQPSSKSFRGEVTHSKEAVVTRVVKHSSSKDDKLSAKQQQQPDGSNPEKDTFTVADSGNKVNLPSKWSRLHIALSKLADEKMELRSKMNGNHFVEQLQQQGGNGDINHLMIIQAQLLATIDDVTSIPVEQWTINNRSTWQALCRVHHHLELIQQSMTLLGRKIHEQSIITSTQTSTRSMDTATCSLLTPTCYQHSPLLSAVTYSSLQGLLEYVEACVTLQHRSCELAIAQVCQHKVILALLDTTMETVGLTTTIRHLYSILDKSRDTIFLYDKCH